MTTVMAIDHHSGHGCDCAAHRVRDTKTRRTSTGLWASVLPFLACAVCPACLATYAKFLSVAGVGLELSELQHVLLLSFAIGCSVAVSAWRSWTTKRSWPIATALAGSMLVLAGHAIGELHAVEWAGVITLMIGGLSEHFRLRRLAPSVAG